MSRSWKHIFPLTTVYKLVREISDHNPLILDTMKAKAKKNREFRFEKIWVTEDDFLDRVSRSWSKYVLGHNNLGRLQKKLKNVKKSLKGWGANLRGTDIKRKK
jgi:hypothetical protein